MKDKKVRVRSRRLDRLDEAKFSLALYLILREEVEDETTRPGVDNANGKPTAADVETA